MRIIPLAADSLGTRSMATSVRTRSAHLVLDPSAALGPKRYGLPPHQKELARLRKHWRNILCDARSAKALTVGHYHYDHYSPDYPELFKDKLAFLKHPSKNINKSQAARAKKFIKALGGMPEEIIFYDGTEYSLGKTNLVFSEAVPHGGNTKLGSVVMTYVRDGVHSFIHTSDVEGPATKSQLDFIMEHEPKILYSDGPLNFTLKAAIKNMIKLIKAGFLDTYIIDHHGLRDKGWREKYADVFKTASEAGVKFCCAAEFIGEKPDLLEAHRKELWV